MRTSCCPVSPILAPHYLLLGLLPLFITPTLYKSPVRIPAFSNTPSPHSHSQASQPRAPPPRLQPPHTPHPAMTHPGNIPKGPPHPPLPSILHPLWMTSFEVNCKFSKTMLRFCFSGDLIQKLQILGPFGELRVFRVAEDFSIPF